MAKLGQKCAISLPDLVEALPCRAVLKMPGYSETARSKDTSMIRPRSRHPDDRPSTDGLRAIPSWIALSFTARLCGVAMQTMDMAPSGIGRRLGMIIEQGIIGVGYRLLAQAGALQVHMTDVPRRGAQTIRRTAIV